MYSLLFIDDDLDLLRINQRYFTKKGYQVETLSNLNLLSELLKRITFDCILLDIMMPQRNGFEILSLIQKKYTIPIIFLSGISETENKIKGLHLGANDYLTKPYDFEELNARIQVHIRLKENLNKPKSIQSGPLFIDLENHKVTIHDEEIYLSNREFDLFVLLIKNKNQLVTYEELGRFFWQETTLQDRNTIMAIASRLRKKLASYPQTKDSIESIRGKGYKYTQHSGNHKE